MRRGFGTGEAGGDVQLGGPVKLAGGLCHCPFPSHHPPMSRHHVTWAANTGVEEDHLRRRIQTPPLWAPDARFIDDAWCGIFAPPLPPNEDNADPGSVLALHPYTRHPRAPRARLAQACWLK